MAKVEAQGHIDCPVCGTKAGMRIAPDKNGEPFGYCVATCSAQLRIGGDKARVAAFVARYPWAKPAAAPVTAPVPAPAPKAAPKPKQEKGGQDDFDNWRQNGKPAPEPAPAPAPKKPASPFDILSQFNRT